MRNTACRNGATLTIGAPRLANLFDDEIAKGRTTSAMFIKTAVALPLSFGKRIARRNCIDRALHGVAMETFYMLLTLSSLAAPQVLFFSNPHPWPNELACQRALPRMEAAVTMLIRHDPSELKLFGEISGDLLNHGYFVSASECKCADPGL